MIRTILLCAAAASLLSAETQQERGRRVVNEALAAMGGRKFQQVADRIETGRAYSFYHEKLRGLAVAKFYTRYGKPQDPGTNVPAQSERQSYGKDEDQVIVFPSDGKGYILTYRGAKPLPDDRILRYRESTLRNILYIFRLRLDEPGMIFESAGADIIENNPVELVDITDSENRTTRVAFHRSTKLPIRQTFEYRDPKTKEKSDEVFYFSKWREIAGGTKWPFHIERQRNGEKVFEIFSDGVEVNKGLGDDLFRIPGSMKVLPEDK